MLDEAKPFAKSLYQTDIFQLTIELARSTDGLSVLYGYAHRFDQAGVFFGGVGNPTKMHLNWLAFIEMRGINSILELLSEMRMLAITKGDYIHEVLSKEEPSVFSK